MTRRQRILLVAVAIGTGAFAAAIYSKHSMQVRPAPLVARETTPTTSRADLAQAMDSAEQRLTADPADGRAGAAYAQAALRRARVESNGGYTLKAVHVLEGVLAREPGDYNAL